MSISGIERGNQITIYSDPDDTMFADLQKLIEFIEKHRDFFEEIPSDLRDILNRDIHQLELQYLTRVSSIIDNWSNFEKKLSGSISYKSSKSNTEFKCDSRS